MLFSDAEDLVAALETVLRIRQTQDVSTLRSSGSEYDTYSMALSDLDRTFKLAVERAIKEIARNGDLVHNREFRDLVKEIIVSLERGRR